jgi:hypothetical protein
MFELKVLVLELRAIDAERAGTVVPLEVSSLDHELWDPNGMSREGFEHFDTATTSRHDYPATQRLDTTTQRPNDSTIRQLDNSRTRRLDKAECAGSGSGSGSGSMRSQQCLLGRIVENRTYNL